MERKGKSSIKAQIQVADGKLTTLQADPECREMARMVADLNRRVIRVQTHGMASWQRAKGRPRAFGVEVAREATEEDAPAASSSVAFYAAADEPAQHSDTAIVRRYLEDVEQVEGKPGPVKRTLRGWLYGKPPSKASGAPGDSCCCQQVEAVAGKMTVAEASGMRDEAVDRLLVDVYFQPPPKQGIARRAFRSASETCKKFCERLKSAVGRLRRRRTEPRVERGRSTRKDVGDVEGAKSETVEPRHSRQASTKRDSGAEHVPGEGSHSARGSQHEGDPGRRRTSRVSETKRDSGAEHVRGEGSHSARGSQHEGDPGRRRTSRVSETVPRESRGSSEEELEFRSAESDVAASAEGARSRGTQGRLQTGHNVGVYLVRLEGDDPNRRPKHIRFAPNVKNGKANGRIEDVQEDNRSVEDGMLQEQNELSHCDHHKTVMESDQEIEKLRMEMVQTDLKSELNTANSERPNGCTLVQHGNEQSKSHDQESSNNEDNGIGGVCFEGERPDELLEESERVLDLLLSDRRDDQSDERRVVGTLQLFILGDSSEFDWEPVPELSEERSLASQRMGELEFEEDSQQNKEDDKSSSTHSKVDSKFRGERPLQDSDGSQKRDSSGPSSSTSHAKQEQEVSAEPELTEENIGNDENTGRSTHTYKEGRKTI